MPFDVLPSHHLIMPEVRFPEMPWGEYARLASENAWKKYQVLMNGLDVVLKAADPMNIADRRLKMLQYQYQSQLMPMEIQHYRETGFPMPKNAAEAMSQQQWLNNERQRQFFNGYSGRGGSAGDVGHYAADSGDGVDIKNQQTGEVSRVDGNTMVTVGRPTAEDVQAGPTTIHGQPVTRTEVVPTDTGEYRQIQYGPGSGEGTVNPVDIGAPAAGSSIVGGGDQYDDTGGP